jgi:hypothetical protein
VSWLAFVGGSPLIVGGCLLGYLFGLSLVFQSQNRASWAREDAMFEQLDIDPNLLDGNDVHRRLLLAAETGKFNEVQVKKMTGSIRGQDEKGFTGGTYDDNPHAAHTRRDITESEGAYDGLEGTSAVLNILSMKQMNATLRSLSDNGRRLKLKIKT